MTTNSTLLIECPICLRNYAEVDPITLVCGHTCCIEDGKKLKVCYLCQSPVQHVDKMVVNYTIRDLAVMIRQMDSTHLNKLSSTDSSPKENVTDCCVEKSQNSRTGDSSLVTTTNKVEEEDSEHESDSSDDDAVDNEASTEVTVGSSSNINAVTKKGKKKKKRKNKKKSSTKSTSTIVESSSTSSSSSRAPTLISSATILAEDDQIAADFTIVRFRKPGNIGYNEAMTRLKAQVDAGHVLASRFFAVLKLGDIEYREFVHGIKESILSKPAPQDLNKYLCFITGMFMLDQMHYIRENFQRNRYQQSGVQLLTWSCEQNFVPAMVELGIYYTRERDVINAFEIYLRAAHTGLSMAQAIVGNFYYDGVGCDENMSEALRYAKLSSDQDDSLGHMLMGEIFLNGYCVRKDLKIARNHYQRAADLGEPEAIEILKTI